MLLVMHVRGIGSPEEAVAWLGGSVVAERPVTTVLVRTGPLRVPIFRLPPDVHVAPVSEWPSPMCSYLRRRHVTEAQAVRWRFGFAVEGRLAGRVVIVARRSDGSPASYAARAIGRAEKRYLFPRADEHADLSVLFGEEYWPTDRQRSVVYVTEGALDALAVERALGNVAIASLSGSSAGNRTLSRLGQFGRVVLVTDTDMAGDRVAERIATGLACGPEVVRARLPVGSDADSLSASDLRAHLCAAGYTHLRSVSLWP